MTSTIPTPISPAPAESLLAIARTAIPGTTLDFSKRESHIVTIKPEAASIFLQLNVKNRKMKAANFTKLTTDMSSGNFRFTGESITFDQDGRLLNGQHRLTACVHTGVAIEVVIVTGVATIAQSNMDAGSPRSLRDTLELNHEQYPAILAPILVGIQSWERGERNQDASGKTTDTTSLEFLAAHPEVRDIAKEAYRLSVKIPGLSAKQIGVYIWVFDKLNVNDRVAFFDKLVTGTNLSEGDPILVLRNFLHRDAKSTQKVSKYYRTAVTSKAWNAYRDGSKIGVLRFSGGGSKPEAFPEPM
jgi:hypothetical protein